MGGKSKKQTIGYKYYLGQHLALCHGPIDNISRLSVDDRVAWSGISTGGSINVSAEELFGGSKREGGVSGTIDVEMGRPDQGQNSYLVGLRGALVPAYRGIVGLVFRQCYLGNNPYLKKWSARGQRIHVRQNGIVQWYDVKSEIINVKDGFNFTDFGWSYQIQPLHSNPGTSNLVVPSSGWIDNVQGPFGGGLSTPSDEGAPRNTNWPVDTILWLKRTLPAVSYSRIIDAQAFAENGCVVFINGQVVHKINENNIEPNPQQGLNNFQISVPANVEVTVAVKAYDEPGITGGTYFGLRFGSFSDINPAHIIRECLTDPEWGMGYTDNDIDNASFMEVADTLYAEGLGMSLLWDRQLPLEDFVQTVLRHIDAALYVSRTTGKYVLKAIRGGYDVGSLITLDESNISSVQEPVRVSFGELTNSVTVKYWDAVTGKDGGVTVTDTALVQQQGVVINAPVQYPGFTNSRNATIAAQRDLRALSSPLLSCEITANSVGKELNIGDVFKFSWAKWGLSNVVMRVTGISYGTGRNRKVKISCTEDVFETNTVTVVTTGGSGWTDPNAPPSVVTEQLATEAPYYELVQALGQADVDNKLLTHPEIGYVIAAASRPAASINATLMTDDGSGYEDVGTFDFCASGFLSSSLSATQTAFTLADFEDLDEVAIGSHVQIGNELMRVDAVNPATGELIVGRGILDTVPQLHIAGEVALFWDLNAGFDATEYVLGEAIDVKVLPISGSGVLPIGEATPMTVTLDQRAARPYPPGNLQLNGESYTPNAFYNGEVAITWAHRNRLEQTGGTFDDHTTGDIGPEVGTLYRVQGYVDGVLVHTEDDIDGTTATWTPESQGLITVEVHSKRDGIYSWQGASHDFVNANFRLTQDDDYRYTEDGAFRVIED